MTSHDKQQYASRTTAELPPPLLSVDDAAAFLRVSRRQVYRLVESGQLRPLRVGTRLRFRLRDLEPAP
jgi:excisionase family DNA binding protein